MSADRDVLPEYGHPPMNYYYPTLYIEAAKIKCAKLNEGKERVSRRLFKTFFDTRLRLFSDRA